MHFYLVYLENWVRVCIRSSLRTFPRCQRALQLRHCLPVAVEVALGISIDRDSDSVTSLIRSNLWIEALFMTEARLSLSKHLEVDPVEDDVCELALNVPPKKIVA
jgi:hypothetical protein